MATTPTQQQLMEQLVRLTDAVKDLAYRQAGQPAQVDAAAQGDTGFVAVTDADEIRQRVAFSYQALGALTGRVSTSAGREFDVRIVEAKREPGVVRFRQLPAGADWVELRSGSKIESLRIHRDDFRNAAAADADADPAAAAHTDDDNAAETNSADAARHERHRHRGRVHPQLFSDADPIGSTVFLRTRRGPLVAFGPRLAALPTTPVIPGKSSPSNTTSSSA